MKFKGIIVLSLFLIVLGSGCIISPDPPQPNIKECSDITDINDRDLCYMKQAIEKKDATQCQSITNPDMKTGCPTWVNEYDDYDKWYTYYFETIITPGIPGCNKIEDTNEKDLCYMKEAIEEQDTKYCEKLINPDLIEGCPTWVSEYDNYDNWHYDIYEAYACVPSPETGNADLCYMEHAITSGQTKYCDYLENPDLIQGCPIWVNEYDKYSDWFEFYIETYAPIGNP
ncbi:MAG: hypothetical protein ABH986_06315 [archaeon]